MNASELAAQLAAHEPDAEVYLETKHGIIPVSSVRFAYTSEEAFLRGKGSRQQDESYPVVIS